MEDALRGVVRSSQHLATRAAHDRHVPGLRQNAFWMGQDRVVSTTIYEVLDELRGAATSEADKGSKLEQLMLAYLKPDPMYGDPL